MQTSDLDNLAKASSAKVTVIIPARMGSSRLPGKMLKKIGGKELVLQVVDSVRTAGFEPYVATDNNEICELVNLNGATGIMTQSSLKSGTDRTFQALQNIEKHNIQRGLPIFGNDHIVVNVQGDMVDLDPAVIKNLVSFHSLAKFDITTSGVWFGNQQDALKQERVKAVVEIDTSHTSHTSHTNHTDKQTKKTQDSKIKTSQFQYGKALMFSRARIPTYASKWIEHIGIYAFFKSSLAKFVSHPVCYSEQAEQLEQLRAYVAGLNIGLFISQRAPVSIDTPKDIEIAEHHLKKRANDTL